MADFLVYFPPSSRSVVVSGAPQSHWAGDKLKRVAVGDTVWVVTHDNGRLILLFPLIVGWRCYHDDWRRANREASKHLGDDNLWESKCHLVAREGTVQKYRRVDIASRAKDLRFVSETGKDRLDVVAGRITLRSAQQMQNVRLLTDASAKMLREIWRKASGVVVPNFSADIPNSHPKARPQGAGFGNAASNEEVEFAAMNAARVWYEKRGWEVVDVTKEGVGYDLRCMRGGREEHAEVKGVKGDKEDFLMWFTEKDKADTDNDFVVFVVTDALSSCPKLRRYNRAEFARKFRVKPVQFRAVRLEDK